MRSAKDWVREDMLCDDFGMVVGCRDELVVVVERIQKDAWNSAIDAAQGVASTEELLQLKKE